MRKLLLTFLFSGTILSAQEKFAVEYRQQNEANPEKVREFEIEMKQKGSGGSFKIGGKDLFYQLDYANGISVFSKIETINNDQSLSTANSSFAIHMGGEHKELIGNQSTESFSQDVILDGENYRVNYPFKNYEWKVTTEEATILGYKVIKAIAEKEGITAWFAPEIKVNIGPNQINGLPGLILKSETQLKNKFETKITMLAEKINLVPKKAAKLKKSKGKDITSEEFKKLQEESKEKFKNSFSIGVDKNK
ncbi:GLPGLI family protein [Empedobacter brevis]|uniref:GLPGLI family protein n=1 Tax=Empedobacter brevis TaxID=247 RepID=A0AAJ1V678_9FLAO|nr:GLPGLI family protein [Empedobacter brevis]MDM1070972.1 GLPGLI family protein [Empedobacter brevis]